jgi:hypothetical protein
MIPQTGDQIPMFPKEPGDLRLCLGCRTKYEADPDLHAGGWCPTCGSRTYEPAVKSDYRTNPKPEPEPEPEPETLEIGSTEDYKHE